MLNFLRTLRRNNMNGKYLKYAIGEVLLVVVGIMIALAINTWNENRKEQQYLSLILKEIHNDITTDLAIIYGAINLD
jgi:sensor domain CHASE-containing protein